MSNSDVEFINKVISEVKRSGRSFTKDLLKDCYFDDLQGRGVSEPPIVSDKWIDYYWQQLGKIPYKRLEKAAASSQKLAKLLVEVLGK